MKSVSGEMAVVFAVVLAGCLIAAKLWPDTEASVEPGTSPLRVPDRSGRAITLHDLATPHKFPPLFSDPGRQAPRELIYKTVDGQKLKLYVFDPPGHDPTERRPAILFIHGGGWGSGVPSFFFPHARYYASRGAVALSVQYRLSGKDGATIFDGLVDCKSAVRYIRKNAGALGVDRDRIAAVGDSAGGHLAAALGILEGFDDPQDDLSIDPKPNAMLLYNPVLDLVSLNWTHSQPGIRTPDKGKNSKETFERLLSYGATPEERARLLSPIHHITAGQPPALPVHGTEDQVVPLEQITRFAWQYEKAGNRIDLSTLDGIGHAFVLVNYTAADEVVVDAIRTGDRFLGSLGYLEGKPTLCVPGFHFAECRGKAVPAEVRAALATPSREAMDQCGNRWSLTGASGRTQSP